MNARLIVAHPGTQHSSQAAIALQRAGLLERYVTSFYYRPDGALSTLVGLLPSRLASRVERELLRRRIAGLGDAPIQTAPALELAYVVSARLGLDAAGTPLLRWRNHRIDGKVAALVRRTRPAGLICYDTCGLQAFRACHDVGSTAILDQTIGHATAGGPLLAEEADRHPEFADTLPATVPAWLLEQTTAEARLADMVLAGSSYVKQTLTSIGVAEERIVVVPYGADVDRFTPAPRVVDGTFRILFVGAIGQRKGVKYLLEAVKRLDLPNAELVLAGGVLGSGDGLKAYQGHFRHVPNTPHGEIHRLFQQADVFVYPSLHEGSAVAIYEALAAGLPVITTPNAGSVVRHGHDGFIAPIRDVDALMEHLLYLYEHPGERAQMGRHARATAERFTWKAYHERLQGLAAQVIAGRAPGQWE